MTLKTLLLGSAAAFAVVGGAQAADLSVAEPVESVKVCDTFGAGYWYIPGSDTCLKIGGNVEFDINLHDLAGTYGTHSSNYDFVTKMGLTFDASSMTDAGQLDGHVALQGSYDGKGGNVVKLDGAWLRLGALKAGHFGSLFGPDGDLADVNEFKSSIGDTNHIELSWAAAGFGLALGIEDPRETWGTSLPANWSMPLITGKISGSAGGVGIKVSAGFVQLKTETQWGIDGQLDFALGANDKIRLNGAYGGTRFVGPTGGDSGNGNWSAYASFQHMFNSTLSMAASYTIKGDAGEPLDWAAAADLVWTPYTGFQAKLKGGYLFDDSGPGVWMAQISLKRSW